MRGGPFPVPAAWKKNTTTRAAAAGSSSIYYHPPPQYYPRSSMSAVASPGRGGGTTTTTIPRPPPSTSGSDRGGGQQPQRPSRLRECMQRIPLVTTLVTIACLALQLCVLLLHWDIGQYAISPAAVLEGACVRWGVHVHHRERIRDRPRPVVG